MHGEAEPNGVQLWCVELEPFAADLALALSWLSEDEQARAARFHFEEHRQRFILSHAVLRALLAPYEGVAPRDISFSYGPHGKPEIRANSSGIQFNMSHCGPVAAYAFTQGCEIGVDIERIRPLEAMDDIAARFFERNEASQIRKLPDPDRVAAFFRCWTLKEAFLKANGAGLSIPLDSFRVAVEPHAAPQRVGNDWTLQSIHPADQHLGAVAYRGSHRSLHLGPPVSSHDVLSLSKVQL
jgi:4'-phosphopantetheinyl transferase